MVKHAYVWAPVQVTVTESLEKDTGLFFFFLIFFFERETEVETETDTDLLFHYFCLHYLLFVCAPTREIKPPTLAFRDDAPTDSATLPGLCFLPRFLVISYYTHQIPRTASLA